MSDKRATITFNSDNLDKFDEIAEKKGMNRTALINYLMSEFIREEKQKELMEDKK